MLVKLLPVIGALIVVSIALAGFGGYEYSQYSSESGIANGLSTQVSSLGSVTSSYSSQVSSLSSASLALQAQLSKAQANVTALSILRDSLQAQLAQANVNTTALEGQINALNGQIAQLKGPISTYQSLLGLSVTNTLVGSHTFNLPLAGGASSTAFPFVAGPSPRSWGDVGIVVSGQAPTTTRVTQTGYQDCISVTSCTVNLTGTVAAGDILLVFVSGYSPNLGWQGQSVRDNFGTSFVQYRGVSWQSSTSYFSDYVFYEIATSSGSADAITVTYNSQAQHSDPVAMDVTGSNLSVYSGSSASCTSSCSSTLATSPAALTGSYVAAAEAYADLGAPATAGSGWTQISTGANYMTGEYNMNVGGGGCSFLPLLPSNYTAKYAGYLSVNGTSSSSAATALVYYPGTPQTTANFYLGNTVAAIIPIVPGNVIVQLEYCGTNPFTATLTIKEVT